MPDAKADLVLYLETARRSLLGKLDGLSDYDVRRPLVPTGTNLLGLVKHVAGVAVGYFGETFARPFPDPPAWFEQFDEPNVDMWATADESRADIVALWDRAWAHADTTIDALDLDTVGRVPWWPDDHAEVTLQTTIVHMIAETNRHAGHADIVRELIDGTVGLRRVDDNMPEQDAAWWAAYHDRVEAAARAASGR